MDEKSETAEAQAATEAKLIVFGGNGFVGSRVCEAAHGMGLHVVSVNRSGLATHSFAIPIDFSHPGRPSWLTSSWADDVEWIHGDALQPACYIDALRGALGAVSCVGGFGSNAAMYRICGEANIRAIETAASVKVPRFAFISVYHETLPGFVKQIGYFRGKLAAEEALRRHYASGGVSIQPFFVHGMRHITESLGIPLQAIGIPLEKAIGLIPNARQLAASIPLIGTGLIPPVRVESVARAAVRAATDPAVTSSAIDVWEIAKF